MLVVVTSMALVKYKHFQLHHKENILLFDGDAWMKSPIRQVMKVIS
jgi:hypothetical protein